MRYSNHHLWFPSQKNKKNEAFDAKFGLLNKTFGNCNYLNDFRYVWTFFKTKILDFWQSGSHTNQKIVKN